MSGLVRTVLGDIDPARLGRTNYHEHLFQVTPLLPGDELDDEELSGSEAASMFEAGIDAMVDATPIGLGRNPEALARISAQRGLGIIMTTGAHRHEHYAPNHWIADLPPKRLASLFLREVTLGAPVDDHDAGGGRRALGPDDQPIRAGLLKVGIGYWRISSFEHRIIEAVGQTHCNTGAPIMVHLEHGSASLEILALLEAHGVAADRVILAHIDRNPDPGLHTELAAAGAYLGYDGSARHREWPDSALIDCLLRVDERGGGERILLGGDVARSSRYTSYGGMPGLAYLPLRFLPRLVQEGGGALVENALVRNPARILAFPDQL